MEIARLHLFPLREPSSGRRYAVLKLETRSGLVGFGECRSATRQEFAETERIAAGTPVTNYEVLRLRLAHVPALQAAVNLACLDVVGQQSKAPLHHVLGGPTRFKVRAMTRLGGKSDEQILNSLSLAQGAGHRVFLVPAPANTARNQGRAFVLAASRRLEQLRAAAGEGVDFVLDGGGELSPADAANLAREFEGFHLLWFDEPCALANLSTIRKISSETVTPLGFGRGAPDAGTFQDLLREKLIDVLRPELSRHGISSIRKMAALAETYYVAVAPRHDGGPIATAAALHLAASLPNFFVQEVPFAQAGQDRQMRSEITGTDLESAADGCLKLPAGHGLGLAVRDEALKKHRDATI